MNFTPAVSKDALKSMRAKPRKYNFRNRSDLSLEQIARIYNPVLRGWIEYYGKYYKSGLYPVFRHFNITIIMWVMRKFRKFKRHKIRASKFLERICKCNPNLFAHWRIGMVGAFA
jgi:RNA-directed DNA polymerase